jgi:glucose/arabinose dehydrogenase/cytochrome c2
MNLRTSLRYRLGPLLALLPAAVLAAEAGPPAVAGDATPAVATADNVAANAGKALFRAQCALCHSAEPGDEGGAQGPELHRVYGRKAAGDARFAYTTALQRTDLIWNEATLARFLAAPTELVPGTAMGIAVPDPQDRRDLVAYFRAVREGSFRELANEVRRPLRVMPAGNGAGPSQAEPWRLDAPGRRHRVDLAHLAEPFQTPAAANPPRFVPRPQDAQLHVPEGFAVAAFATGLGGPRTLRIAPNGDVFVAETQSGPVRVLRPSADGTRAEGNVVFAQGLSLPSGMAFWPAGADPQWLYVAETNRVVRYPYRSGDRVARGLPEIVVAQLAPTRGGHFTRDIAFSADGQRLYVSVGSQSNIAEAMPKKPLAEAQAWDAQHGLGAAWGPEERRANVLVFDARAPGAARVFATGIRNCVGLVVQPATGELWCTTNERDLLGDDLVPDYSTRVREGGFYGWPWYYFGSHEDPRLKGERPDLAGKATVPDVPYQAHSAALNLAFYEATGGTAAFPAAWRGEGFAALHGSWNRGLRTGHKVVRVLMKEGVPTGEYEDFLTGFITGEGDAWGRPVCPVVARDGALLVSDDAGNAIWRVAPVH